MKQTSASGSFCWPWQALLYFLVPLVLFFWGTPLRAQSALPDLIINRARLVSSIEFQTRTFTASECASIEGCLRGTGPRKLLRFEAAIANIGQGDLVIGRPEDNPHLFEFSECHGHFHLRGVVTFQLCRSDGSQVLVAEKQAFCLRDNEPYSASAGPSHGYDCEQQGITAGWQDIYFKTLDCQWLDVTGVPGGNYLLKLIVNPGQRLPESNYGNNSASVIVRVPGEVKPAKKAKKAHLKKAKHKKKKQIPPGWLRNGGDGKG